MSPGRKVDVLVTGGNGQVGTAVRSELDRKAIPFVSFGKTDLDITNLGHLDRIADEWRPTVVVNCAADTRVAKADLSPTPSWQTNGLALGPMAEWCARIGATLVHLSSDFVFGRDPGRNIPYDEDDPVGPFSNYGVSKLCGEYEILRRSYQTIGGLDYYIIRTAGVFRLPTTYNKWRNFPTQLAALLTAPGDLPVPVVEDVVTNVTMAEHLAQALLFFIEKDRAVPYGIYHVTNPGDTTWFQVASVIAERLGCSDRLQRITRHEYRNNHNKAAVLVPAYTCLSPVKYQQAGGPQLPGWGVAINKWCDCYMEMSQ